MAFIYAGVETDLDFLWRENVTVVAAGGQAGDAEPEALRRGKGGELSNEGAAARATSR